MSDRPRARLLRPDMRCPNPRCGAYPASRITPIMRELAESLPPETELGTSKCGRCGEVYPVRATAYQRAA